MIRPFSSPHTAQLWYLTRTFIWFLAGVLLISVQMGYLDGYTIGEFGHEDSFVSMGFLLFAPLMAFAACCMPVETRYPLTAVPGRTSVYVQVELFVVWVLLASSAYAYWLALELSAPGSLAISASPLVYSIAFASVLQAIGWTLRSLRHQVAGLLIGIAPVQLLAFYVVRHLDPFADAIGPGTLIIILALGVISYRVSLRFARRFRHEESRPGIPWSGRGWSFDSLWPRPRTGKRPFPSPESANAWYERRQLVSGSGTSYLFWLSAFGMIFYSALGMYEVLPGAPGVVYWMAAFGVVLVLERVSAFRTGFEFQLPASDWSLATAFLRIAGLCLLAVASAVLCMISLSNYLDPSIAPSGAATLLFELVSAFWTGWIGIALAPGALLALQVVLLFGDMAEIRAVQLGTAAALILLILLLIDWRRPGPVFGTRSLIVPLVAAFALFAVNLVLSFETPVAWIVRESMGAGLVLAILYHLRRTGDVPIPAAKRIALTCSVLTVLSCGALALQEVNAGPVPGPTAIFLAFGVIPPVFLPLLVMPQYIRWARLLRDRNREFRKRVRWMT